MKTNSKRKKFEADDTSVLRRNVNTKELRSSPPPKTIVLSLKYFDQTQGQDFKDWESEALLAKVMKKFQSMSQMTVVQAITEGIVKQYKKVEFPPKSDFFYPKHIPQDVIWCSIHVQNKECLIGFFEDYIFHLVFLDQNHRFWITEKKNT